MIGIATLLLIIAGAWLYPHARALYHQVRGGRYLEQVLETIDGSESVTTYCLSDPLDDNTRQIAQKARGHLVRSIEFKSNYTHTYLQLGIVNCLLGEFNAAIKSYSRYTELRPENPLGYIELALAYEGDCRQKYNHSPALNPLSPQGHNCPNTRTQNSMDEAWRNSELSAQHLIITGEEALEAGHFEDALNWSGRANWINQKWWKPWYLAGQIFESLKDTKKATLVYIKASKSSPKNRDIWYALGHVYREQKEWNLAIKAYESGISGNLGNPGLSNFYYWLGHIRHNSLNPKDNDGALEAYEQAVLLDEYSFDFWQKFATHSQIGSILASSHRWEEAIIEFEIALNLKPNNYQTHISLAYTSWRSGKKTQAEEYALKAIEIEPQNKRAYEFLGNLFREEGDVIQARVMYNKVLELDPQDSKARKALKSLDIASD